MLILNVLHVNVHAPKSYSHARAVYMINVSFTIL